MCIHDQLCVCVYTYKYVHIHIRTYLGEDTGQEGPDEEEDIAVEDLHRLDQVWICISIRCIHTLRIGYGPVYGNNPSPNPKLCL
jgi:hypothetical protein